MQHLLARAFRGNSAVTRHPVLHAPSRLHRPTLRKKKCRATASLKKTFMTNFFVRSPVSARDLSFPFARLQVYLAPAAKNDQCRRSLHSCASAGLLMRLSPCGTHSSFISVGGKLNSRPGFHRQGRIQACHVGNTAERLESVLHGLWNLRPMLCFECPMQVT